MTTIAIVIMYLSGLILTWRVVYRRELIKEAQRIAHTYESMGADSIDYGSVQFNAVFSAVIWPLYWVSLPVVRLVHIKRQQEEKALQEFIDTYRRIHKRRNP